MFENRKKNEPNLVVGFCDKCLKYFEFDYNKENKKCPTCNGDYSKKNGFQITSQRTFDYKKYYKKTK